MANVSNYLSLSETATGTVKTSTIDCSEILLLQNDGATGITFNFDNGITSGNTIRLKIGESLQNLPIKCTTLYYIATGGDEAFRMIGLKNLV